MNEPTERSADPRIQTAIVELQDLIIARFPSTTFEIGEDDDPDGVYVRAVVDVDDTDEVTELFIDRMIDIQVDDGLPVYVVPERQAAARQKLREERMALYG